MHRGNEAPRRASSRTVNASAPAALSAGRTDASAPAACGWCRPGRNIPLRDRVEPGMSVDDAGAAR
jgi:hypothetical protein